MTEQEQEETWETKEVRDHLLNDPSECYHEIMRMLRHSRTPAQDLRQWIEEGNAPQVLYDSLNRPPKSSLDDVDWQALAAEFVEEEDEDEDDA